MMSTLTWHRGSLRPYESLWLTLRKLAYLNSLKSSDFPLGSLEKYRSGYTGPVSDDQSHEALAKLIEEPFEHFKFSDTRHIPECWEFLFTKENAFCDTCLSMGYHTRLFSLKLLDRCPIHDEPLHVDCACMKKHGERVDADTFRSSSTCSCGSVRYFDPSQLHKNQNYVIDTEKLTPIVSWLESLSQIYVVSYMNSKCDWIYESNWLMRLHELSQTHGLPYPSALIKHKTLHYQWAFKTQSIEFSVNQIKQKQKSDAGYNFYWHAEFSYPVDVFKAFARHMRKHVARRSEYWVRKFQHLATPEKIASLIRSNHEAKLAFTELIWATCIEITAQYRRWDNRKSYYEKDFKYKCEFSEVLARKLANLTLDIKAIDLANQWVSMHIFGVYCLALWKQAEILVEAGISQNKAFWMTQRVDQTNLFSITATKVANEDRTEFTFYVNEALSLPTLKKMTKEERGLRYRNQCEEKRNRILKACSGLCLSWSQRQGWHTAQSGIWIDNWKPRKILFKGRQYLNAVLYRAQGHFVLQLVDYKLQVLSLEFSGLFDLMRLRFFDYCKLNQITLEEKIKFEDASPSEALRAYESHILEHKYRCIREINHMGFCNAAYMVYMSTWALSNHRTRLMADPRYLQPHQDM